jgi:hypothetical protein
LESKAAMHDDSPNKPAPTVTPVHPAPAPPVPYAGFDDHFHPAPQVAPAPLAQNPYPPQYAQPAKKSNWKWWAIGGVIVWQFLAPHAVKPTTLAGGIMADWSRQIMAPSAEYQLLVAKHKGLAEAYAQTEASYADKVGKCELAGLMGPELARACMAMVDQYHKPALEKARRALEDAERQLGRR